MYLDATLPEGREYEAFLEGLKVEMAFAANEEEGWIDQFLFEKTEQGHNRAILKDGELQKQRLFGKVELRRK